MGATPCRLLPSIEEVRSNSINRAVICSLLDGPTSFLLVASNDLQPLLLPGDAVLIRGGGAPQSRADQMCAPKFCVGSNSGPRRPVGTAAAPASRARKRPEPGVARSVASSTTTRPRLNTVAGQPVMVRPS